MLKKKQNKRESEEANVCLPQGSRWTFQATTMDGSFVSSESEHLTPCCRAIISFFFGHFSSSFFLLLSYRDRSSSIQSRCRWDSCVDASLFEAALSYSTQIWTDWTFLRQTVNPILILIMVPVVDNLIYPLIKKCKLNFTWVPLKAWLFLLQKKLRLLWYSTQRLTGNPQISKSPGRHRCVRRLRVIVSNPYLDRRHNSTQWKSVMAN